MIHPGMFNFLNDVIGDELVQPRVSRNSSTPAVNVKETKKSFELQLAVPGLDKKDINIDLDENVLTISSKTEEEQKEEVENFKRREFRFSSFERSFTLPEDIDETKIEAKHENGILSISIPKKEAKPSQKKLIKIQ